MSTSLFFASSAAFQKPMVACTRKAPLRGVPRPLPPLCRRSGLNGHQRSGPRAGVGQVLPEIHASPILRFDAVVVARACLKSPGFVEGSEGWR